MRQSRYFHTLALLLIVLIATMSSVRAARAVTSSNSAWPIPASEISSFDSSASLINAPSACAATIGGVAAQAVFAGAQDDYVGLDQVNLPLSPSLMGRGEVGIVLTVDGRPANPVRITIR